MEDLKIDTKVSIDFDTIKKYLKDNGFKIVTNKNRQLLNSHSELKKINPDEGSPRTWINDPRYSSWCDEESTRGFADFELWNLDATMVELLYERLVNFPLLDGYSTGDGNRDEDIKKAYNQIINLCKKYLKDGGESILNKDKEFKKIWQVWSKYGLEFWC